MGDELDPLDPPEEDLEEDEVAKPKLEGGVESLDDLAEEELEADEEDDEVDFGDTEEEEGY